MQRQIAVLAADKAVLEARCEMLTDELVNVKEVLDVLDLPTPEGAQS